MTLDEDNPRLAEMPSIVIPELRMAFLRSEPVAFLSNVAL